MPREQNFGGCLRLDILTCEKFEKFVRHAKSGAFIVHSTLFKIVAIAAREVAVGAGRLQHYIKWTCERAENIHAFYLYRLFYIFV